MRESAEGVIAVLENKGVIVERRGVKKARVIAAMPTTKARLLKLDVEEVDSVDSDEGEDMQKHEVWEKGKLYADTAE